MPPPRKCECGECSRCKHRVYMRNYYRSTKERKELMKKRSREHYRWKRDNDPSFVESERARGRARDMAPVDRDEKKQKARQEISYAVKAGRIRKPSSCQKCGARPGSRRIHAHHPDYSKPLDVRWLCSACHGREHRSAA